MKTIKNHLEFEKAQLKPNKLRIDELSTILKRGTLTREEWRMTGRFTPAEEYLSRNVGAKLIKNCKEVIEYVGDSIIEVLHTGYFVFEDTESKSIDEVEDAMWSAIAEKLWCENC
jgi:hypothetical protein